MRIFGKLKVVKVLTALACATWAGLPAVAQTSAPDQGEILSAFFGLNDSMRIAVRTSGVCKGRGGRDGMPVIFSREIETKTLDAKDFQVTTAAGKLGAVRCVTLRPADEPGEMRTVLLIGDFGSDKDQPVRVEVTGDIRSRDGLVRFQGASAKVIPLEAGPTLVLAEDVPKASWTLGGAHDCPKEGLVTIVRAIWAGGVTKSCGGEISANEARKYRVTVRQKDGAMATVIPMAVGDLNDNDNNHELCLDVAGTPESVFFPAGLLKDPNGDLNPDTKITVTLPRVN